MPKQQIRCPHCEQAFFADGGVVDPRMREALDGLNEESLDDEGGDIRPQRNLRRDPIVASNLDNDEVPSKGESFASYLAQRRAVRSGGFHRARG